MWQIRPRRYSKKKTSVVWICGADREGETGNRSLTLTCGGKEKQREADNIREAYNIRETC